MGEMQKGQDNFGRRLTRSSELCPNGIGNKLINCIVILYGYWSGILNFTCSEMHHWASGPHRAAKNWHRRSSNHQNIKENILEDLKIQSFLLFPTYCFIFDKPSYYYHSHLKHLWRRHYIRAKCWKLIGPIKIGTRVTVFLVSSVFLLFFSFF